MDIVILSRDYAPVPGDVLIQIASPPQGVLCIDPQHGGHRPGPDWPAIEPGDAACTFASRLWGQAEVFDGRIRRTVLPPNASLDSWVAAAVLWWPRHSMSPESVARITALAAADGAEHHAANENWTPGQDLHSVSEDRRFAGLCRLVACAALPPERRLALVQRWLTDGVVDGLTEDEERALGIWQEPPRREDWPTISDADWAYHYPPIGSDRLGSLTSAALNEIQSAISDAAVKVLFPYDADCLSAAMRLMAAIAGNPASIHHTDGEGECSLCFGMQPASDEEDAPMPHRAGCPMNDVIACQRQAVALVTSSMSGLSGGRGALSKGYQVAPVVVAVSPTGDPRVPNALRGPLVTVARAANARGVRFPFAQIVAKLNQAEAEARGIDSLTPESGQWGGNPASGIIGSPKPQGHWQGTRLDPERIAQIVLTCLSGA